MKLTKDIGVMSTTTLDQDHKLHTKEFFNLSIDNSPFSNVNKFFSFYVVQNIHKGIVCQVFLQVLPTKDSYHPRRVSLTKQERTQDTPKREKKHMLKNPRLCTMKKNVIDRFYFKMTKETSICQIELPPLDLVQS